MGMTVDSGLRTLSGGSAAIIRSRRLFEVFPSKGGNYSREAINRGKAIIGGNTVLALKNDEYLSKTFFLFPPKTILDVSEIICAISLLEFVIETTCIETTGFRFWRYPGH